MKMKIRRVGTHEHSLPRYETEGASGMDLRIALRPNEVTKHEDGLALRVLSPGERVAIGCGFAFAVPPGFELQVRGRSSGHKRGLRVWFGTVDSDYRGEVSIAMENISRGPLFLHDGERVAQGVVAPVVKVDLEEVSELDATARGAGGWGSTGTK